MRLTIIHLRHPIPVAAYDPPEHPHGEAIAIRVPAADPKQIGIVPGMEGDLELDDGSVRRIKIGKKWTADGEAGTVRIEIATLTAVAG